jgi:hypothetical protein
MMMVAPSRCCKCGWIRRAIVSVDPPGGYATTILILPEGQLCACAVSGATSAARNTDRLESIGRFILPKLIVDGPVTANVMEPLDRNVQGSSPGN